MRFNKFFFALLAIVIFGFFLRIYNINQLPGALNPDEAALSYNAYSILKTGADEHGVFLPLSLQSFGDWKLPIYSYFEAISIGIFGMSKLSFRLPSILAGVTSIILIYFISKRIFKNRVIAILSALFLAINPWSIFFSRGTYEVNIATAIFIGGLLSFLVFLQDRKKYLLFLSSILFGVSMFTQHNYILFAPLFVAAILIFQKRNYKVNRSLILAIILFFLIALVSFFSLTAGGGKKASNLNIFNDEATIYNRADKLRGDNSNKNKIVEKLLYNKYTAGSYQTAINYLNAYSPSVLFDKGGERLTHNLGDFGYFYLFDSGLFLSGVFFLIWKREKKQLLILLPWLVLAPLPSAITREHTGTRLFTMVPPMILISSYGFYNLIVWTKNKKFQIFISLALVSLLLISLLYFLNYYFVHFNAQRMRFWRYGYEDAVRISNLYPGYNIVMRGPENFPYIYFLLYNEYDPVKFRKEVKYYPETDEGFMLVKSFGRYKFVPRLQDLKENSKTLYFDDQNFGKYDKLISLPSGEPVLKYYVGKDLQR